MTTVSVRVKSPLLNRRPLVDMPGGFEIKLFPTSSTTASRPGLTASPILAPAARHNGHPVLQLRAYGTRHAPRKPLHQSRVMINHRNDTQQSGFGSIASWRSDLHFFDIGFCAVWSKLIIRSLICQQNTVFHIVRFPGLLSWKLPSTSMETSTYFRGSKSASMEASTYFHRSKSTSMEINYRS